MALFGVERPSCVLLALILIFLYELEENIVFPPTVRWLEDAICRKHYASSSPGSSVSESMCKTSEIQSELAFIRGWYGLFKTAPAILIGPYFGSLADRIGRRPVYALCLMGMILHLLGFYLCCYLWNVVPIFIVWVTSIFLAMGGGTFVILGLNVTMVSDLTTREERSQMLYIAFTTKYVADLIGPQIAAVTLANSLWLPVLVCELCFAISLLVLVFLPETLEVTDQNVSQARGSKAQSQKFSGYYGLLANWRIRLGMSITFLTQFRYLNESILLPYVSTRFLWSISQVSRLLSIVPGVSLLVFLLLPRALSTIQSRFGVTKERQNVYVTRSMLIMLVGGGFSMAAAPSADFITFALVILSAGNGVRAPLLAVASTYVDPILETGRLYTLMSITDAFSHMVGDPTVQHIWSLAIDIGDPWLPLPYLATASLFTIAFILSLFLPSPLNLQENKHPNLTQPARSEEEPLLSQGEIVPVMNEPEEIEPRSAEVP